MNCPLFQTLWRTFLLIVSGLSPTLAVAQGTLQPDYDLFKSPAVSQDSAGARLFGGSAGEGFGKFMRAGDLNGDGKADLIVGTNGGKIVVWMGRPSFSGDFDAAGTDGYPPQTTVTGFVSLRSLTVGDINGDGRADIIVGFTPTAKGAGNVAIILGRPSLPPSLSIEHTGAGGADTLILPKTGSTGLAMDGALVLGDFNKDGIKDIIMGDATATGWSRTGNGEAFIVLGRQFLPPALDLTLQGPGGADVIIIGASNGDALTSGGALEAADVNGDGKTDLILGAPDADGPRDGRAGAGEVYVVLGRSSLAYGEEIDLSLQGTYHGASTTIYGGASNDALTRGGKITTGDVNGDGILDILVGTPGASGPDATRPGAGQACIVYGRASFPATFDLRATEVANGRPDVIIYGGESGDALTQDGALAVGDVNGDGVGDIVFGAHSAANFISGGANAGQAYIVMGRKSPAAIPGRMDVKSNGAERPDVIIHGARSGDHLTRGGAILVGDWDGDGVADLILGADGAAGLSTDGRPGAGRAYAILGRQTFVSTLNLRQEGDLNAGANVVIRGAASGDALTQGGAMALADVNGDGNPDLILGAPGGDGPANSRLDSGHAFVINGSSKPELTVFSPQHAPVFDRGSFAVGRVAKGAAIHLPFTIKNTGRAVLSLGGINLAGTDAALFTMPLTAHPGYLIPGGTDLVEVVFNPSSLGLKKVSLFIQSSDPDENHFVCEIQAIVINPLKPVVNTLPATALTATSAMLSGLVNPTGLQRQAVFEYGHTVQYGMTSDPITVNVEAPANELVSATLTDLQPHSLYHYRVVASSLEGAATGADRTFVTANRNPTALDDNFKVTDGAVIRLDVLANDYDADEDYLTIATFTQPKTTTGNQPLGKLVKTGNSLIFTAPSNFSTLANKEATFTYTLKDAFGGTSTAATAIIQPVGAASIDPPTIIVPANGTSYDVVVTSEGLWSHSENVSWLSVRTEFASILPSIRIVVAPNNSLNDRSATITIAGQPHQVTQRAAVRPVLQLREDGLPHGLVGKAYYENIGFSNGPATFTATHLPPGLTLDAEGNITGIPTKAGAYDVTIKARNVAGAADETLAYELVIDPLHSNFPGTYLGCVSFGTVATGYQGGRLEVITTGSGTLSGKLVTPQITHNFTGRVRPDSTDPDHPEFLITLPNLIRTGPMLGLTFDATNQTFTGQMGELTAYGWRNSWNRVTQRATAFGGLHTFRMDCNPTASPANPQGNGFASFTVNEATGIATVNGRLPDNSTFSSTGCIGQDGQVLIFQPLYAKKGWLGGVVKVTTGGTPAETSISALPDFGLYWYKPASPAAARDTVYASGFPFPLPLFVEGGVYPAPGPGAVAMGLTNNTASNAILQFTAGGLPAEPVYPVTISNPSATGLTNKAIPVAPVANQLTISTFNAATGAFSGTFSLFSATPVPTRKVTYQGQIVRVGDVIQGFGFFLLPELPDAAGETLINVPKLSGKVSLEAATSD